MPAREIIILEMVEYTVQELAKILIILRQMGQVPALNWAQGVAFRHKPLPLNKKILLEKRIEEGKIYWANVMFANMPKYKPSLKVGARDIPVLKTPNPLLKEVARWIKKTTHKIRYSWANSIIQDIWEKHLIQSD